MKKIAFLMLLLSTGVFVVFPAGTTASFQSDGRRCPDLVEQVRAHVDEYMAQLPNFICELTIQRRATFDLDTTVSLDEVVAELSFYEKVEHLRVLTVGGRPATETDLQVVRGLTSRGEFAGSLKALFDPATGASFECDGTEKINGKQTIRLRYKVPRATSSSGVMVGNETYITAYRGRCWVDPETKDIVRLNDTAEGLPSDCPITFSASSTDFGEAEIAGHRYWLPAKASVRIRAKTRVGNKRYDFYRELLGPAAYPNFHPPGVDAVNVIKFGNYHKFETKVRILK